MWRCGSPDCTKLTLIMAWGAKQIAAAGIKVMKGVKGKCIAAPRAIAGAAAARRVGDPGGHGGRSARLRSAINSCYDAEIVTSE
jgi:hypothetical protein